MEQTREKKAEQKTEMESQLAALRIIANNDAAQNPMAAYDLAEKMRDTLRRLAELKETGDTLCTISYAHQFTAEAHAGMQKVRDEIYAQTKQANAELQILQMRLSKGQEKL